MSEKLNITFEEGYEDIELNGDPNRVLRVNMGDVNIIPKLRDSFNTIKDRISELEKEEMVDDAEANVEVISKIDRFLRDNFDELFYKGASEIVFGNINPLAPARNGKTVYENFMEAFIEMVTNRLERESKESMKRIEKYQKAKNKQKENFKDHVRRTTK